MLKGAIYFFALFIFLFGCTTKIVHSPLPSPPPPPPEVLPDITPYDISLIEEEGKLIEIEPIKKSEVNPKIVQKVEEVKKEEVKKEEVKKEEVKKEDVKKEEVKKEEVKKEQVTGIEKIEEKTRLKEEVEKDLSQEVAHLKPLPVSPKLEVPQPPPLIPDLTITNLFLNPRKRLAVTIANIGNSPFPMGLGNLKIFLDGQLKESYGLNRLSDQTSLQPNENITFTTPLILHGRREVQAYVMTSEEIRESDKENNYLEKILEGIPIGPDITIKDLDLTEDFDLFIILTNAGEIDLRKEATFRIRVFVNNLRISQFDHFISDMLKANFGNDYTIFPPHRVTISSNAKVKITLSPRLPSDDIFLENNILERTFVIFPFTMVPQEKQEFLFSVPSSPLKDNGEPEKLRAELRWDGGEPSLMFSLVGPENIKSIPTFSGKSPIKVEIPIYSDEAQKERLWKVSVTNRIEKKVEGHLIIQHP